jgi:hypothetical protein
MTRMKKPSHHRHTQQGEGRTGAALLCIALLLAAGAFLVSSDVEKRSAREIATESPKASDIAKSPASVAAAPSDQPDPAVTDAHVTSAPEPAFQPTTETSTPAATLVPNAETAAASVPAPELVHGSYTRESNALVYDEDALVLLGDGGLLSSPNGVMVSDEKQKLFVGDLTLETGEHTMVGTDAVLDLEQGRMTGTNMTITFGTTKGALKSPTGDTTTIIMRNEDVKK